MKNLLAILSLIMIFAVMTDGTLSASTLQSLESTHSMSTQIPFEQLVQQYEAGRRSPEKAKQFYLAMKGMQNRYVEWEGRITDISDATQFYTNVYVDATGDGNANVCLKMTLAQSFELSKGDYIVFTGRIRQVAIRNFWFLVYLNDVSYVVSSSSVNN